MSELIAENGVDGFIEIENKINSELKADKSVIATGGSVVYGTDAMKNLKNIGKVIYLKQDFENIQKRVQNIKGRGVVLKENQTLEDLYNERSILYDKYADIVIEEGNLNVEETLNVILNNI